MGPAILVLVVVEVGGAIGRVWLQWTQVSTKEVIKIFRCNNHNEQSTCFSNCPFAIAVLSECIDSGMIIPHE